MIREFKMSWFKNLGHRIVCFFNRPLSETITYIIVFFIFCTFALSYLYIFFWGIIAGLKTHSEIVLSPFNLPKSPQWQNYIDVFRLLNVNGYNFFGMLYNSLYFSLLGPLIQNMISCMLAYVTNKYKFLGSKFYMLVVTVMLIMPIYGSGGSAYRLYYNLGLINSYAHIILAFGGMNMTYLLYHAAFSSVSWSYAEAAFIDGANDYSVFFKIMLPQVMKIFGALFLLAWIADWNNYSSALIYLPKLPTLAGGIYLFELDMIYHVRRDILYAAYMITAIPPLILFAFFNKTLMSNVSLGGIKE